MKRVNLQYNDPEFSEFKRGALESLGDPVSAFNATVSEGEDNNWNFNNVPLFSDVSRIMALSAASKRGIDGEVTLYDLNGKCIGRPYKFNNEVTHRLDQGYAMLDLDPIMQDAGSENFLVGLKMSMGDLSAEHKALISLSGMKHSRDRSTSAMIAPGKEVNVQNKMYDSVGNNYNEYVKQQMPVGTFVTTVKRGDKVNANKVTKVRVYMNYEPEPKETIQLPGLPSSIGGMMGIEGGVRMYNPGSAFRDLDEDVHEKEIASFYDTMQGKISSLLEATVEDESDMDKIKKSIRFAVGRGRDDGGIDSVVRKSKGAFKSTKPVYLGSITWSLSAMAVINLIKKLPNVLKKMDDTDFVVDLLGGNNLGKSIEVIYAQYYASRHDGGKVLFSGLPIQRGPSLSQLLKNTTGLPAEYPLHSEYIQQLSYEAIRIYNQDQVDELGDGSKPENSRVQLENEEFFSAQIKKGIKLINVPGSVVQPGDNYVNAGILAAVAVRLNLMLTEKVEDLSEVSEDAIFQKLGDVEEAVEEGIKDVLTLEEGIEWNPMLREHGNKMRVDSNDSSLFSMASGAVMSFSDLAKLPARFLKKGDDNDVAQIIMTNKLALCKKSSDCAAIGWDCTVHGDSHYTLFSKVGTVSGYSTTLVFFVPELNLWGAVTADSADPMITQAILSAPSFVLQDWCSDKLKKNGKRVKSRMKNGSFEKTYVGKHIATPPQYRITPKVPPNFAFASKVDSRTASKMPPLEIYQNMDKLCKHDSLISECGDFDTGYRQKVKVSMVTNDEYKNPMLVVNDADNKRFLGCMMYNPDTRTVCEVMPISNAFGSRVDIKPDEMNFAGHRFVSDPKNVEMLPKFMDEVYRNNKEQEGSSIDKLSGKELLGAAFKENSSQKNVQCPVKLITKSKEPIDMNSFWNENQVGDEYGSDEEEYETDEDEESSEFVGAKKGKKGGRGGRGGGRRSGPRKVIRKRTYAPIVVRGPRYRRRRRVYPRRPIHRPVYRPRRTVVFSNPLAALPFLALSGTRFRVPYGKVYVGLGPYGQPLWDYPYNYPGYYTDPEYAAWRNWMVRNAYY